MRGRVSTVTATTVSPVTLDEAKRYLRVDDASDDDDITALLLAALSWLQPPQGWIGQSICAQSLRYAAPCWESHVRLPAGPVAAITSVKYFDVDNVETTVAPELYFVDDDVLNLLPQFSRPTLFERAGAVRIEYVAGPATAALVDPVFKAALKMLVKELYDAPGSVSLGATPAELPYGVQSLLMPFKRWW